MNISHEDNKHKGSFFILQGEDRIAEVVYSWFSEDGIIIEHTEVDPSLEGKGVGAALVNSVVEMARANALKIMPLCPFAHALFERKNTYNDVWYKR